MKELIIMIAWEGITNFSMLADTLKIMLPVCFVLSTMISFGFYDKAHLFCGSLLIVYVGCELIWQVIGSGEQKAPLIVILGVIVLFAFVGALCGMIGYKFWKKNNSR